MRISLDYEEMIPVNGDRQSIRIRSADAEHPVMLFLHGGPGVCNRHLVLRHNGALADRFTRGCWDQPDAGAVCGGYAGGGGIPVPPVWKE